MPVVFGSVNASYVPREAAGTVLSAIEKSRTDSSDTWIFAGAVAAGLRRVDQPPGASAGSSRSTIRLSFESVESPSEYGSVTVAVTIFWAAGCQAATR